MATAGDVAQRALTRILVESPDSPLDASEYSDALDSLNSLMAAYEENGIRLGYTAVDNVADEVTVPDGAIRGIVANLAIEVAPDYGGKVSAALVKQADEGLKVMRKIARPLVGNVSMPPTLPLGSGNDNNYYNRHHFYDKRATALITLQGNSTATGITASATYVKARGFWDIEDYEGLRPDITGRVTNTYDHKVTVNVKATLTLEAGTTVVGGASIHRNGRASELSTTATVTTTPSDHTISGNVTLQPGEYVELFLVDLLSTNDITLVDARIEFNRSQALT